MSAFRNQGLWQFLRRKFGEHRGDIAVSCTITRHHVPNILSLPLENQGSQHFLHENMLANTVGSVARLALTPVTMC